MLNRTNRTLSAQSNRLNLGTRSFALVANGNIGNETLRHAHAAPDAAVRAGVVRYPVPIAFGFPISGPKPIKTAMRLTSGSSPMSSWPEPGCEMWAQVSLVADASAVVRPVADTVVNLTRWGVALLDLSPSRLARTPLASCRRPVRAWRADRPEMPWTPTPRPERGLGG